MRILMLAGEESGIFYAERLKKEIVRVVGDPVTFRGYAESGFKASELAVMGFWPVLRHLFYFLRVARTMKEIIRTWRPDVVVSVDYPGLNLKLDAYAKRLGIPAVHLVCPQVWAWHRGRIPKVAAALTKLLCFFPFEPSLFASTPGFSARFIGHPLVDVFQEEGMRRSAPVETLRAKGAKPVVALLPGSRTGEIARIFPVQLEAAAKLRAELPQLAFVVPAASPRVRRFIDALLAQSEVRDAVTVVDGGARDVLRSADAASVASGTATLEAALAGVPTVLVYAVSAPLAWFARHVVTGVRFVGLANIVAEHCAYAGREPPRRRPDEAPGKDGPMPELLQEALTPEALAATLRPWLVDSAARDAAQARLASAMRHLHSDGNALGLAALEIRNVLAKG